MSSPAEVFFDGKPTGIKDLKVIFDSGSSYTYFGFQVYEAVLNLVNKRVGVFPLGVIFKLLKELISYFMSQVRKGLTKKPLETVQDKALPICWKGTKPFTSVHDVNNYFSTLTLKFKDTQNIQLELQPEAYLIVTVSRSLVFQQNDYNNTANMLFRSQEDGNACFGILNGTEAGLGDLNVIGGDK